MKWTQLCPFYRFRYLRYLSVLSQLKPMVNLWNWDLNILNHKVIIIFFSSLCCFNLHSYMSLLSGNIL